MTVIDNQKSRKQYIASTGEDVFGFNFKIFLYTDLNVYLTPVGQEPNPNNDILTVTTDYTVNILDQGGSITLVVPATAGDIITIERALPYTRQDDFEIGGNFDGVILNKQLDKLTILMEQVRSIINERSITYQVTDSLEAADLTIPRLDANEFLKMDNGRTGIIGVELEESEGWSALRSELENNLTVADGASLIGYNNYGTPTTLRTELRRFNSILSAIFQFDLPKIGDLYFTSRKEAERDGWIIADDATFGNEGSGAVHSSQYWVGLYKYWWENYSQPSGNTVCIVDGGLGASAQADWDANKKMDMLKVSLRAIAVAGIGKPAGTIEGETTHTLTKAEIPAHVHTESKTDITSIHHRTGSWECSSIPYAGNTGDGSADGLAGNAHNNMQPTTYLVGWWKA